MSMFVWEDGTVSGSVNVEEHEAIQQGLKGLGKRKLAKLPWPIESAAQLADALAALDDDDDSEPAKSESKSTAKAKTNPTEDAATAEAMTKVDLPDLLDKATGKKGSK